MQVSPSSSFLWINHVRVCFTTQSLFICLADTMSTTSRNQHKNVVPMRYSTLANPNWNVSSFNSDNTFIKRRDLFDEDERGCEWCLSSFDYLVSVVDLSFTLCFLLFVQCGADFSNHRKMKEGADSKVQKLKVNYFFQFI